MDPLTFTLVVLGLTVLGFISDRLPLDLVAFISVLALYLGGVLDLQEALAGFSDPMVLLIGALFVLGGALQATGVADRVGAWLLEQTGDSYPRFVALVVLITAPLSAFMSSTGTVALLLPAVVAAARASGRSLRVCLLPLAFGALMGGTLTLIATPPNLIASAVLEEAGQAPFGFFEFTPLGLLLVAVTVAYFGLFGRRLLGDKAPEKTPSEVLTIEDLALSYQIEHRLREAVLPSEHPMAGRTPKELRIAECTGVTLLGWLDGKGVFHPATASTPLQPETRLLLLAEQEAMDRFFAEHRLDEESPTAETVQRASEMTGAVELLLTPRSRLIGRSLSEIRFTERFGLRVLAVKRRGRLVTGPLQELPLSFGDSLLVGGPWQVLKAAADERDDYVAVGIPRELEVRAKDSAAQSRTIGILVGMLILFNLDGIPPTIAAMIAAASLVATRCLSSKQAYRSINWESLMVIASLLPMATALEKTGGVALLAQGFFHLVSDLPDRLALLVFFLVTALLNQFLSNTATAVILAPVAWTTAMELGVSGRPFLMAVAIAASCAFLSPVASPVNTLVVSPGGYRFVDFVRVGMPLLLIVALIVYLVLPVLFPL